MIVPPTNVRVLVATAPVDFRKGMDGLAAYVQAQFRADPYSGIVYVFRSKRADKVKLLFFDGTGVVLVTKRLEGARFRWPKVQDGVMRLSPGQLSALLEGLDWTRARACAACRAAHSDAVIHIRACREAGAMPAKSASLLGMTLALEDLPDDVAALKAMLVAARAETARLATETADLAALQVRLEAEKAALAGENARLKAQAERFAHILRSLRRAHFGRSSEKISDDQLNLALEDVSTGFSVEDAKAEAANTIVKQAATEKRRTNRGSLPAHLPREEIVVEPESKACPCCGGTLHVIGEDTSERLDKIPAKLRVLVTRRPKYACRQCERTGADQTAGIIQAPAPAHLIEGGLPTEALVADVLVSKYADHLPLYRQSQILARDGVDIDHSTLCHWVGFAAFELEPLHAHLLTTLKASAKLFCDETRCPVLDPGRGKTKTGYLWALARDDRPWGGSDPPAVVYAYAPGRRTEHAVSLLAGFTGTLQVDGYAAYRSLADPSRLGGPLALALCWSHFRRRFYDIAKGAIAEGVSSTRAPIASEALQRVGALYAIEAEIRGKPADARRAERQARTRPLVEALKPWLETQLRRLPGRSPLAEAIRYGLSHWDGLARFLHDGRIEIDTNVVERSIRPIALNRENALFAGSDEGGANWAIIASLIETAKLNGVNPHAWLTDTLTKLVNRWPASRIDALMPWTYAKASSAAP